LQKKSLKPLQDKAPKLTTTESAFQPFPDSVAQGMIQNYSAIATNPKEFVIRIKTL
jgi:hypothetical protein